MGDAAVQVAPETWRVIITYYAFCTELAGRERLLCTPKKAPEYAARYLLWAAEQQIDPILFMRFMFERFAHAKPGSRPHLSGLRSKKLLAVWREKFEGRALQQASFRKRTRIARTAREREVLRLRAKPKKAQEAARLDYGSRARYELCMLDENTGGYDPRSRVCPGCPSKYACLLGTNRRHGFDVGALRVGLLDRVPQDVALIARGKQ